MALPPEPPKAPKSAKPATPAPRRSSRTASTAKATPPKAATPRAAPAAAVPEPKAPTAARPVPKRATTRKAVAPAVAPSARAKPGPKPKTTAKAAPKSVSPSVPNVATADRRSLAASLPPVTPRTVWSLGAVALAAGAGIAAFLTRGRILALLTGKPQEGHVPIDLLDPNRNADDRAVADFRPDMAAPMTAAEREALRPPPGLPN